MSSVRTLLKANRHVYAALRGTLMAWRRWRFRLRRVHPTFYMSGGSLVSRDLVAREFSYIGPGCLIGPKVELGPYAMLGPKVCIVGGDHVFSKAGVPIIFSGRPDVPATLIEGDAWVGCGAILLAGVRIGRGAIVAAGAVITRDVPPYEIHAGVPAQKIRDRFASDREREAHDAMLSRPPQRGTFCADAA